jgi:radical SAM superfamily enzyme YgiQ (UPF0313 family)
MDLLLINAPNDQSISSIPNDGAFPPLGVLTLASAIERTLPHIDFLTIDGQVVPLIRILAEIEALRPRVVAISCLAASYGPSLELCKMAKTVGAVTILGNDHAAVRWRPILDRQKCVDYIFVGDQGEFYFPAALRRLLDDSRSLYDLGFRTSEDTASEERGSAAVNLLRVNDLTKTGTLNRRLLNETHWQTYGRRYYERFGYLKLDEGQTTTTINHARGCARKTHACTFCGILDLTPRTSNPTAFWNDIISASEQVNARIFYEVCDSFTSMPRWIKSLVDAKPNIAFEYELFVYAQAVETTTAIADSMRLLGVKRLNMGLEAGDDEMLRRLKGPRDSLAANMNACKIFKERGMRIYSSLVLGAPGETLDSLKNTIQFAKWLLQGNYVDSIQAQPLFPDFGARTGAMLAAPHEFKSQLEAWGINTTPDSLKARFQRFVDSDNYDNDELAMEWANAFTHVGWNALLEVAAEIEYLAQQAGVSFGSSRLRADLPPQAPEGRNDELTS